MHDIPEMPGQDGCGCGINMGCIIPPKPILIENIIKLEWAMFSQVNGAHGISSCQQDQETFCIMRVAQASIWQDDTLASYLSDLQNARLQGINLMTEKYARMMAVTDPAEYARIKDRLPPLRPDYVSIVEQILGYFEQWDREIAVRYPRLHQAGRKQQDDHNNTSTLTYLRGELLTYSGTTLHYCLRDVKDAAQNHINLAEKILENTVQFYNHISLAELEQKLSNR